MSVPSAKVADLAEQIRGVSFAKHDASTEPLDGYIPVLRAGNITEDGLAFEDLVFVPASRVSIKQKIRKHDVVIAASSGSLDVVGKAAPALEDYEAGFGAFCKVLRPNPRVHPSYFAHYFKTRDYRQKISAAAAGININNLRNEDLNDLEIPLPSLDKQRRIAEVLDRADALRAKRRAALAHLDSLSQSIFVDMFGDPVINDRNWPVCPIGELELEIADGNYSSKYPTSDEFVEAGIPFIRANNLRDLTVIADDLRFITPEKHSELQKGHLRTGDVLITTRGDIGNVAVVPSSFQDANINAQIVLLRPTSSQIVSEYLAHLFNLPQMKARMQSFQNGVALKQLPIRQLVRVPVPVPPSETQRKFARKIEEINKLRARHQAALAASDALFSSLQHRAFRGEI